MHAEGPSATGSASQYRDDGSYSSVSASGGAGADSFMIDAVTTGATERLSLYQTARAGNDGAAG